MKQSPLGSLDWIKEKDNGNNTKSNNNSPAGTSYRDNFNRAESDRYFYETIKGAGAIWDGEQEVSESSK